MSKEKLIEELKLFTNELKQLTPSLKEHKLMTSEISTKIDDFLSKIVNNFHLILSDFFQGLKNYWDFISKHVNNPVTKFCRIYESSKEENEIIIIEKKGKNWIMISILENSFLESMKEILKGNNINDSNKKEILLIIEELNKMEFNNIINDNYEMYLSYLKDNELLPDNNTIFGIGSPILNPIEKDLDLCNINESEFESIYFDNNLLNIKSESMFDKDSDMNLNFIEPKKKEIKQSKFKKEIKKEEKPEEYEFKKSGDLIPNIVDNFYTFIPKSPSRGRLYNEEGHNSRIIINSMNEEELGNNIHIRHLDIRQKSELTLYTERVYRHLPSDELYESRESLYNINGDDNEHQKKISNSRLLYYKYFYKNVDYFKFYIKNIHEKTTSLKEQNYQCYICLKKFSHLLQIPLEPIYFCSYYMRFVCKDCIAEENSIIPQIILKEWCFDKFPISKKAKELINSWYEKPIFYLRKEDINKIPIKIQRIKKDLRLIFNYMKCKDVFDFLERNLPQHKHIMLKEYIFSLKDLVEMHNEKLYKKLIKAKEIFVNHLKECQICKYEGEICRQCQNEDLIFFYNSEEVSKCKKCQISFHKGCLSMGQHSHNNHI